LYLSTIELSSAEKVEITIATTQEKGLFEGESDGGESYWCRLPEPENNLEDNPNNRYAFCLSVEIFPLNEDYEANLILKTSQTCSVGIDWSYNGRGIDTLVTVNSENTPFLLHKFTDNFGWSRRDLLDGSVQGIIELYECTQKREMHASDNPYLQTLSFSVETDTYQTVESSCENDDGSRADIFPIDTTSIVQKNETIIVYPAAGFTLRETIIIIASSAILVLLAIGVYICCCRRVPSHPYEHLSLNPANHFPLGTDHLLSPFRTLMQMRCGSLLCLIFTNHPPPETYT